MSVAVCDPAAFYPLRSLVAGPFINLDELAEIERFVRTVVLHDEISMELQPVPYDPDSEYELPEECQRQGIRNVIIGMGPVLTGYDFFTDRIGVGKPETPDIPLSSTLLEAARNFSNAGEGNVYYKAHVGYLQRVVDIVQKGGSALLAGRFGSVAFDGTARYPQQLFENLDRDWQQLAQEADTGDLGFMVPPVLSIILSRSARREAIPSVITDLRDEWAVARKKLWGLLDQMRTVRNVSEAQRIRQHLVEAASLLSPAQSQIKTRPVRVLWNLVCGVMAGMATTSILGGSPAIGAAVGTITSASRSVSQVLSELGPALFGRGAFDLARRVRKESMKVEYGTLARILTESEKSALGL